VFLTLYTTIRCHFVPLHILLLFRRTVLNDLNVLNNLNGPRLFNVLGETKADGAAPVDGGEPVPVRRAQELRTVVPGTAADHALAALLRVFWLPRCAIGRGAVIIGMITVLNPFPDISGRIEQSKRVGLERTHRRRLLVIPLATAAIAIS
jgi:hypothetical protein